MSDEKKNKGKKAVEDTQDDRAIKAAGLLELFELANGINFMIHHGEPAPELAPVAEPATPAKPAEKRKYKRSATRIPPEAEGIQVNFCKNPTCANYGVPAMAARPTKSTAGLPGAAYTISGASTGAPVLSCKLCGEYPTIKSNLGISEELERLSAYLKPKAEPSCPELTCANFNVPISAGTSHYYKIGKTPVGSVRYKCKACAKTFSVGKPTRQQRLSHKNKDIFMMLMNKVPFRRICEMTGVNISTLYDKIDFIHKQCMAFAAAREGYVLPDRLWRPGREPPSQSVPKGFSDDADEPVAEPVAPQPDPLAIRLETVVTKLVGVQGSLKFIGWAIVALAAIALLK